MLGGGIYQNLTCGLEWHPLTAFTDILQTLFTQRTRMKKIGTTTTGTLIIEVSKEEYHTLLQTSEKPIADQAGVKSMSHAELAAYAADRLRKLAPKKRVGVVHSIEAMFQFNGGISSDEIEKLIATLQKRRFFTITSDGKVTYLEK